MNPDPQMCDPRIPDGYFDANNIPIMMGKITLTLMCKVITGMYHIIFKLEQMGFL